MTTRTPWQISENELQHKVKTYPLSAERLELGRDDVIVLLLVTANCHVQDVDWFFQQLLVTPATTAST